MTEENQDQTQTPPQDLPAPSASEEAGATAQPGDDDYVGEPDTAEEVVETETQTEEVVEPDTQTEEAPTPTEPAPVEAGADAAPTEDSPAND